MVPFAHVYGIDPQITSLINYLVETFGSCVGSRHKERSGGEESKCLRTILTLKIEAKAFL